MGKKETILYGSPSIVTLPDAMCRLYRNQLSQWTLARKNVRALKYVKTRTIQIGAVKCQVQLNPARAISSKAKLDEESIRTRQCFLCRENRPEEQMHIDFEGAKGKRYDILVNPFPVLPDHFIVASDNHVPQLIWHRYVDMLRLCKRASGFTILYNGPKSGASAPDHFHFQAIPSGMMPVELFVAEQLSAGECGSLKMLTSLRDAGLYLLDGYVRGTFVIVSDSSKSAAKLFYRLLDCSGIPAEDSEPGINVFSFRSNGRYVSVVIMRRCHRSSHYFSEDPARHLSMGLGCVDMGGVIITVDKDDYDKLNPGLMAEMLEEVTVPEEEENKIITRLKRTQSRISIELMSAGRIEFEVLSYGAGRRVAVLNGGRIEYGGQLYDEIVFDQRVSSTFFSDPSFVLHGTDGSRSYTGGLVIRAEEGTLKAINVVGVEDYLLSRMSDNMPAGNLERCITECRRAAVESSKPFKDRLYCGFSHNINPDVRRAVDNTWGQLAD